MNMSFISCADYTCLNNRDNICVKRYGGCKYIMRKRDYKARVKAFKAGELSK